MDHPCPTTLAKHLKQLFLLLKGISCWDIFCEVLPMESLLGSCAKAVLLLAGTSPALHALPNALSLLARVFSLPGMPGTRGSPGGNHRAGQSPGWGHGERR